MTPFKSKAQEKYLFANEPGIAKRWAKETPDIKKLPEKKPAKEQKSGIKTVKHKKVIK
jgi:hypothetical protein